MKNNSPTEAGQINAPTHSGHNASMSGGRAGASHQQHASQQHTSRQQSSKGDALIDAINQVFALFKLNYHNQFYKAFNNTQDLNSTKRLWLDTLSRFSPEVMLRAAKSVIETSEYLPTLRTMICHCEAQTNTGLPDAHAAYIEACRAPTPKSEANWSHLAVYYAGKASDWYFLQTNSESVAFPVFKQEYEKVCQKVMTGEQLAQPVTKQLPEKIESTLSKSENLKHLASLKDALDL